MWASARANKSGYIRETFRPVGNKILRGPGKQLGRKGNRVSFKEMHCFPVVGAFLQGMEEGDRSQGGGTTRAEKFSRAAPARAPGPRAHLDPTWPTAASRPAATLTLSTWVPVSSLPGHLRPQPHLRPGHLGPRRPRALPVHLRAGRLRRGGREARGRGAALALRMRVQAGP